MGYVKHDAPDLFISYSRADDQGDEESERPGWVTTLSRLLRKEVDKKLGKVGVCDIWMDHRLAAGDVLDQSLDARVRESATMLIVLSPGYLGSSWCKRELDLFLGLGPNRQAGSTSRVFVIETDRVERPEALEMILGLPFWAADPDNVEFTNQLGYPYPHADRVDHKPYFNRLNYLAHAVAAELKRLREIADQPEPDVPKPGGTLKATIYLARGTDDVDDQYLEVREYLLQQGFQVVPQGDYPQEEARYAEEASKDLAGSLLFVQLLGSLPGRRLAGSTRRHVGVQHELALAARRPILRWRSRTLPPEKVENPEQAARLAEPDVLALELEEFKSIVLGRAEAILNPPRPTQPRPTNGSVLSKLVFINADIPDQALAKELGKELEKLGAWVSLPCSENEANPREYVSDKLDDCDGFLLVYGGTKSKWVTSQLRWSRKTLAQRDKPASLAVVEVPPTPKEPLDMLVPNLKFLKGQPLPTEGELEQYLQTL